MKGLELMLTLVHIEVVREVMDMVGEGMDMVWDFVGMVGEAIDMNGVREIFTSRLIHKCAQYFTEYECQTCGATVNTDPLPATPSSSWLHSCVVFLIGGKC